MIAVQLLKIIAIICSTTSVEDSNSSWSEFDKIQKAQKECREYFYKCTNEFLTVQKIVKCDKERKL